MVQFDQTKDQTLSMILVAKKLRITVIQLDKLIKNGTFPASTMSVNGVPVWSLRAVNLWIDAQPKPGSASTVINTTLQ